MVPKSPDVKKSNSAFKGYSKITSVLFHQLKIYELKVFTSDRLPKNVNEHEKYLYSKRNHKLLHTASILSFLPASYSMILFLRSINEILILTAYAWLTIIHHAVSLIIHSFTQDFDLAQHREIVNKWKHSKRPSIDIFLPTAGEPTNILQNTWEGVRDLKNHYKGVINVYCLDDSNRGIVKNLAEEFNFHYLVRPNRGEYKKAGNLRYGFKKSSGEFIIIFDADFRPRHDFLDELLPYFYEDPKIGIVQTPQYFDVHPNQNWLERGAGAVQELFYRHVQVSRQTHNASICVGSNAVYRRAALNDTGGTALVEHSEDVHTGFNIRMHGWNVFYIPIILAKGLCPSSMTAFFKQQYRWCRGSMSLLTSYKFWATNLPFRSRLSYFSGFIYYIHTGLGSILLPLVPILILLYWPQQISLINYLYLLPSIIFAHYIFPSWHGSIYGIEAWSTRIVYGWAHLFAIFDTLFNTTMSWNPTGARMTRDFRYSFFRILQVLFNFIPAIVWITLATWRISTSEEYLRFLPLLYAGIYYFFVSMKVTFYYEGGQKTLNYALSTA